MIALAENILWLLWPAVLVVNVGLSGCYSGLEMGVYCANKIRIELRAEAGGRSARILRKMLTSSDNLLAVLLIGTNIHQYLATFAVSAMLVLAGLADHAELYTLLIITPVMFVFGDSVPKIVFQRLGSQVYRFAWFLKLADIVFKCIGLSYLVRLVSGGLLRLLGRRQETVSLLGHEGLAAVLAEGRASGALTLSQTNMAHRVMNITQVNLGDVLQPLNEVISAPRNISRAEFLIIVCEHDYSRIPLLDEAGQVSGVVDVYDVLADEKELDPEYLMTLPELIPATTNIRGALLRMQRARAVFAIATDQTGGHLGIVTVKDIVEEIVGDLDEW